MANGFFPGAQIPVAPGLQADARRAALDVFGRPEAALVRRNEVLRGMTARRRAAAGADDPIVRDLLGKLDLRDIDRLNRMDAISFLTPSGSVGQAAAEREARRRDELGETDRDLARSALADEDKSRSEVLRQRVRLGAPGETPALTAEVRGQPDVFDEEALGAAIARNLPERESSVALQASQQAQNAAANQQTSALISGALGNRLADLSNLRGTTERFAEEIGGGLDSLAGDGRPGGYRRRLRSLLQ